MHVIRMQAAVQIARTTALLAAILPFSVLQAQAPSANPPQAQPTAPVTRESLAGTYDGGQMEVAAQLLLKPDGRFQYELAYGALDDLAYGAGVWTGCLRQRSIRAVLPRVGQRPEDLAKPSRSR